MAVPAAEAAVRLTLPVGSLPGWHATGVIATDRAADLAAGLPQVSSRRSIGAMAQSSAATGNTGRLRSDASCSARRNRPGGYWPPGGTSITHGPADGAVSYLRPADKARSVVAWRSGARIGVIVLKGARADGRFRRRRLRYAVLADGWLTLAAAHHRMGQGSRPDQSRRHGVEADRARGVRGGLRAAPRGRIPAGRRTKIPSGTLAAQWILSYWSQLTPAQQTRGAAAAGFTPTRRWRTRPTTAIRRFKQDPALQALAYNYVKIYQTRLGHTLGLPIVAGSRAEPSNRLRGHDAVGNPLACRIRMLPAGQQANSQQTKQFVPPLDLIVAHEVFHCFQGDITDWKGHCRVDHERVWRTGRR